MRGRALSRLLLGASLLYLRPFGANGSLCPDKGLRPASSFVEVDSGVCYVFHLERVTWKVANETCAKYRGGMVTIDGSKKQEFLSRILESDQAFKLVWTGAIKSKGVWMWQRTGEHMAFSNFLSNSGGRNEDRNCAMMARTDSWKWQPQPCDYEIFVGSYVCEYDGRSGRGTFDDAGNVIGLAVGLGAAFCVVVVIAGVLTYIHRRRQMEAARRQQSFGGFADLKISNIDPEFKEQRRSLIAFNVGSNAAPPAYGQVTNFQGGSDTPSTSQLLLYAQRSNDNDLLASNLVDPHETSKLQDKCLSELIAASDDVAAQPEGRVTIDVEEAAGLPDQLAAADLQSESTTLLQSNDLS